MNPCVPEVEVRLYGDLRVHSWLTPLMNGEDAHSLFSSLADARSLRTYPPANPDGRPAAWITKCVTDSIEDPATDSALAEYRVLLPPDRNPHPVILPLFSLYSCAFDSLGRLGSITATSCEMVLPVVGFTCAHEVAAALNVVHLVDSEQVHRIGIAISQKGADLADSQLEYVLNKVRLYLRTTWTAHRQRPEGLKLSDRFGLGRRKSGKPEASYLCGEWFEWSHLAIAWITGIVFEACRELEIPEIEIAIARLDSADRG